MLRKVVSVGLETITNVVTVTASALYRGDVSPSAWLRRARSARVWLRRRLDATPAAVWDLAYEGLPQWEIGRPQAACLALADSGDIRGSVLDVGCGTGELVLALQRRGYDVLGVDISPIAVALARAKARAQNVEDTIFRIADAFALGALDRTFDTVIDSALFHNLSDRARYALRLASVVRPGGVLFILAISDREPSDWGGPFRITEVDFHQAFGKGWGVAHIQPARYETNLDRHATGGGAEAWLARIDRVNEEEP